MAIVEAIAALPKPLTSATELPLRNYTSGAIDNTHLVMIDNIVVLNPSPDTADGLTPRQIAPKIDNPGTGGGGSGGGGSVGYFFLVIALLGSLLAYRKTTNP